MDWLTISPDLLVIHYEDFLTDATYELKKIHKFLKFPVDENRIKCIRENPYNKWKRPKKENNFKKDPFQEDNLHQVTVLFMVGCRYVVKLGGMALGRTWKVPPRYKSVYFKWDEISHSVTLFEHAPSGRKYEYLARSTSIHSKPIHVKSDQTTLTRGHYLQCNYQLPINSGLC